MSQNRNGYKSIIKNHFKRYYRMYFLVFLVLSVVTVYIFKTSYAIFQKEMVVENFTLGVGELTYDIESSELTNGSVTLAAHTSKDISIKIVSHNPIHSKYELYYTGSDLTNVEVGYYTNTVDPTKGVIQTGVSKTIFLKVVNNSETSQTITFGVEGGFDYNELILSKGNAIIKEFVPLYKEDILHGTDPVLGNNLVPVTIANNGVVTYADTTKEWYNYTNKNWANAVVLEDSAQTYKAGDVINAADIESYFVWIPRYKYKIFNDGNYPDLSSELNADAPQTIEIEFESKNTSPSNGTTKNSWLSHPAFQAFDTNGIWVGKFESGYRGANSTTDAQVGTADSTKLIIKPNTYSWRSITVGNMFKTSYEYLRDNESHMMKNTEWGAVAYLSHSQYGVNREVYINNNASLLTGCGGDTADASEALSCFNAYGSKVDGVYNQSTTGNISGIFDMSGGAWEDVMGYNTSASSVGGKSGITSLYSDFFTNSEWDKYYDRYVNASDTITTYNQRILGDATGEMGPFSNYHSSWYNDSAFFIYPSDPWFARGSNSGGASDAGLFYFYCSHGGSGIFNSFRVVLGVTE